MRSSVPVESNWSEKEQQRVAAIQAKQKQKVPESRDLRERATVEGFTKSIPGRAAAAFDRGNQFFQIELTHAEVTGTTNALTGIGRTALSNARVRPLTF
jgi:hypothetical protein